MWPVSGEAGGSEPDLQAQNQAQCVQQDSPMHGEPAASRHSHGGHYMHLCPEGGGWARLGPCHISDATLVPGEQLHSVIPPLTYVQAFDIVTQHCYL